MKNTVANLMYRNFIVPSPHVGEGKGEGKVKGFTLLELLVYIAVLALVSGFITSIFVRSEELNKIGNKYVNSLKEASIAQSAIRRDLREATEVMPLLNEYKTSGSAIILRMFNSYNSGDDARYIIYRWDAETKRLTRITLIDQKTSRRVVLGSWGTTLKSLEISTKGLSRIDFGPGFKDVKFAYNQEDVSLARFVTVQMVLDKTYRKQPGETDFNFSVGLRAWQDEPFMMEYLPVKERGK